MIGGKESRPNQRLGTGIEGGRVHQLKKGDFIVIPAGVPHWVQRGADVGELPHDQSDQAVAPTRNAHRTPGV
jgi:hypothetical protein